MSKKPLHENQNKSIDNTGFSPVNGAEGERLTNKDGSINLRKIGVPFYERFSVYHTLLGMSRGVFILTVFSIYTSLNIVFATIYFLLGPESLAGTVPLPRLPWSSISRRSFSVPKR